MKRQSAWVNLSLFFVFSWGTFLIRTSEVMVLPRGWADNGARFGKANILDGVANSFSFIMPWHVWPLLMIMTVTPLLDTYPFLRVPTPTDFLVSTFYPIVIWCVMLFAVISGYGRKTENKDPSMGS